MTALQATEGYATYKYAVHLATPDHTHTHTLILHGNNKTTGVLNR